MALAAGTFWEIENGGSDAANGGGFNPQNASFFNDLTVVSGATSASPIVSAPSYRFTQADVNHWLFIPTAGNWNAGWYKIVGVQSAAAGSSSSKSATSQSSTSSVSASPNGAILDAAVGHVVLWATPFINGLNTVAGVATTGSPGTAQWSIDYSQRPNARLTFSDAFAAATQATFTSAGNPAGPNMVGNLIQWIGGTNVVTGVFEVQSVSGTTATLDRNWTSGAVNNGTGGLGGAFASQGQVGSVHVAGNKVWLQFSASVFSITSASNNVANGAFSMTAGTASNQTEYHGYNTYRGDLLNPNNWASLTRPTVQINVNAATAIVHAADCMVSGIIFDGNLKTTSRAITGNASGRVYYCKGINCTNSAFSSGNYYFCETSGCTTTAGSFATVGLAFGCVASANTITGFFNTGTYVECLSINNTGGATRGFDCSTNQGSFINCTSYGNGDAGFRSSSAAISASFTNCLAVNNTGKGFDVSATYDAPWYFSCAVFGNASPQFSAGITPGNIIGQVTLSANPISNAGGAYNVISDAWANFAPNSTSGGGLSIRGAAIGP